MSWDVDVTFFRKKRKNDWDKPDQDYSWTRMYGPVFDNRLKNLFNRMNSESEYLDASYDTELTEACKKEFPNEWSDIYGEFANKVEDRGLIGKFYKAGTVRSALIKAREELFKCYTKRAKKEELENNLDYLKLNLEEKENVMDEFSYLDEETEEREMILSSLGSLLGVLDMFEEDFDDYEAVVYVRCMG
jgi:hypothetical protein